MQMKMSPRLKPRRGDLCRVGNVYATKQGVNGYFLVVGVSHPGKNERPYNNVHMIRFNMSGEVVGCVNEPEVYVSNHKDLVGEIDGEMPKMEVKWYEQ